MQKIIKTIKLEEFRTKYPIIYPSILNGSLNFVTKENMNIQRNGNYNAIPLSVSSYITGYFSNFTYEMEATYGGQSLPYKTILSWYLDFKEYYNILYSNIENLSYSSLTQYYNTVINDGASYEIYANKDLQFKQHGGKLFYQWLLDNYFGELIFRNEFDTAKEDGVELYCSKYEWLNILNKTNLTSMFYVDVCDFYDQISRWHDLYKDVLYCSSASSCCDCSKYMSYGGNTMYNILSNWVRRIEYKLSNNNKTVQVKQQSLMPCMTLNISMASRIEDFGNYCIFSKEYVNGQEYNIGNVCLYEDDVYILKSGSGYTTDKSTGLPVFDTNGWQKYYDYYRNVNYDEFKLFDNNYLLSGRTSSMLVDFKVNSIDSIGNILPGIYKPSESSNSIQPSEGTTINLPYVLGSVNSISYANQINEYFGNVLYSAIVYACDDEGNKVDGSDKTCYEGDSLLEAVNDVETIISNLDLEDAVLHIDFIYYKNTSFHYSQQKVVLDYTLISGSDTKYYYGVKCVDHCTLDKAVTMYYMSSNECYPIYYYDITYDTEEKTSDSFSKTITVNMSDFSLTPISYEGNNYNIAACPMFRREDRLGYSGPENVTDNIYIDRGYATVLDRHLMMSEVTNLDTLLHYGNHSFDIINLEEENNNG